MGGTIDLSDWRPDRAFADAFAQRSAAADIVSFDVFDTALTRLVDSPADAFAELEQRLARELGDAAAGLALAREEAERDARSLRAAAADASGDADAGEVGLDEILDRLVEAKPALHRHRALLRATELAVEADLLVGVPDILAATRLLAARGQRYVFVSDMYLPSAFLAEQLGRAGYAGWHALFVSGETGATKASGRQWAVVRAELAFLAGSGGSLRLLHVGDDDHADDRAAAMHGIATLPYPRARSARRLGTRLDPEILPFSRWQRAVTLAARRDPDAIDSRPEPHDETARWRDLGRSLGGLVAAGFVGWLAQRARRHRVDALTFGARDGWLVRAAWQASGLGGRLGVPDQYLCVSRRTLNLARAFLEGSDRRLPDWLPPFLSGTDGTVPVRTALARLPLGPDSETGRACERAFGSLDAILVWPDGSRLFEAVLRRHAGEIHGALAGCHAALAGYLLQEGFDRPGRLGFVDLGWHGNMQRSLQRLALRPPDSLCGFYYGLWPAALGNRHAAGLMEAAFTSDFMATAEQPGLLDAVGLLEELHTAPHGTVSGYRRTPERWEPVFADQPQERRQYEAMIRPFQDGALETVAALFRDGVVGPLDLAALTPDAVIAAIDAVCLSPTPSERRLLGRLGHCASVDHLAFEPLAPPDCPHDAEVLVARHRTCGWRTGTMLGWQEAVSGARRAELGALARGLLAHHGPRNLRQFD